ncbi:MAG TPA: glycoside hydrolase family 3 N-terminal domain-containing protein [Acidimicrobiales bacterium]|nr:glycoside hydrolase family 3 N-terminal domain-containing protein [Acidimicrobiales bacterium]
MRTVTDRRGRRAGACTAALLLVASAAATAGTAAALAATAGTAAALATAGPVAAATPQAGPQAGPRSAPAVPSPCAADAGSEPDWVGCMLGHMTVAQKVGQLFVVNAYGTSATDSTAADVQANQQLYGPSVSTIGDLIDTYDPGGIIYFNWSNGLTDPTAVAELSNGIQQAAAGQPLPVPTLVSTDQEEGVVTRIGSPATVFPGNMALGATGTTALASQAATVTGQELRAMGVDVDDAPVVDVNTDPLNTADGPRSFGDRPSVVASFAAAQVDGYQGGAGVAATAKHFPGLGDTSTNPDTGVTTSDQTLAELQATNFPPFEAAIAGGVDQVMVTHIVMPNVDPSGLPSSLSPTFVDGLLRGQLGYQGVVITDAMNAQALSAYPPGTAAVMAVDAGEDELLYAQQPAAGTPQYFVQGYDAVLDAVSTGRITVTRIDQSVRRVLSLKWTLGLATNPYVDVADVGNVVGIPSHLAVARQVAQRSITVVKNDDGLLPLAPPAGAGVLVTGVWTPALSAISADLTARGLDPDVLDTGFTPTPTQIAQAVAAARGDRLVVVTTYNAWTGNATGQKLQVTLVDALLATGTPVVVAALGTPYDIAYFPDAPTFVAAYDLQPVSADALVSVIFGDAPAVGRLPVTVTQPPPSTQVLYPYGYGLSLPTGGYRMAAADGGVFAFGDAYDGSMGGRPLEAPVVGIASTPGGQRATSTGTGSGGYWEVAADGGVFAFGDASFYGSMGGRPLSQPVVGMAVTPDGRGYWLVAADGGVFAFGDASYYGSMGGRALDAAVVGIAGAPGGGGYWEVAADGGVFAFGGARFAGSMGGRPLDRPVVAMAAAPGGFGYWEVAAGGGVFAFGGARFAGSMGGRPLAQPVVGVAAG